MSEYKIKTIDKLEIGLLSLASESAPDFPVRPRSDKAVEAMSKAMQLDFLHTVSSKHHVVYFCPCSCTRRRAGLVSEIWSQVLTLSGGVSTHIS